MSRITKVGVVGAGVMGAGIAAQAANSGAEVVLLDIAVEGKDRNAIAQKALDRMEKAGASGALMSTAFLDRFTIGNLDDNLDLLSDCDWIVEAVIENAEIKRDLYRRIDQARKSDSVVSSNTSTIPLSTLMDGMPQGLRESFLVMHFFNPPRHMRLLEFVAGADTRPEALERVKAFAGVQLGKTNVECEDRPGFIANRLGCYWMQCAVHEAFDLGLKVEEADAIMSRPCGFPKTGVFGLCDLVGIDLIPHVTSSLAETLENEDEFQQYAHTPVQISQMIDAGLTGRKNGAGFYRLQKTESGRVKESYDLQSSDYAPVSNVDLKSAKFSVKQLRELVDAEDAGEKYAWAVLSKTLSYATSLVGDAADSVASIDEAMRLGYNWKLGPFEMIDVLGADWFADRLRDDGQSVSAFLETASDQQFYRHDGSSRQVLSLEGKYETIEPLDGVLLLTEIKANNEPTISSDAGSLWDVGDGVFCLEFTTKMNAFNSELLHFIQESVAYIHQGGRALVIYNDAPVFSAGANLQSFVDQIEQEDWAGLEDFLSHGQAAFGLLKAAPFPVVGVPAGGAFGGGCEVLLHCDAIQAHAETYMGLVEANVGIVPGWGGCKEISIRMRERADDQISCQNAFDLIRAATLSKSAYDAMDVGYLRPGDGVTMNRDRLLYDAKQKALSMIDEYMPLVMDGVNANVVCSPDTSYGDDAHDQLISQQLAEVLSYSDDNWEQEILDAERATLMTLVKTPAALERIKHMLETGKPLRN